MFNDESYNSTASIIYDLIKRADVSIDRNLANLIATGILSDSAEFRNAFPNTFIQIGELLEKGGTDYQSLLLEMQHLAPPQTRANFIKDLFASKITLDNGLLMLHGAVAIHANKIADDAIKIGADAAIFYTINKGKEISFSARLRPPLDKTYNINLGKLMKKLAPLINGQGGGHPCAAGAYGSNTLNTGEFLDAFFSEISKRTYVPNNNSMRI
jgi:nanoRNase/pAp phosphatase (c-di-AMP/oligoRNAs hydrolase)